MSKKNLLFVGPVQTASGYGVHARQVLRALVDSGRYDIYVESLRWGETGFVYDQQFAWIEELARKRELAGDRKYDISVQVTIPNEFKKLARFNVGFTAGIEVDRVSPTWLIKTNQEVDMLIVPSQHSAHGFTDTRFRGQDGSVLTLEKPIAIVAESFADVFTPGVTEAEVLQGLDLPEKNFLVVGLGLDKPLGEDRKNISNTVLWFLKEFDGQKDVSLILKASIVNGSLLDFETIKRRVGELRQLAGVGEFPKINLVHGRLSDSQLADLYRDSRITALVSFTHGEGFGLPLLEAAACAVPIVATDWSGHLDFLTIDGRKMFYPVEYTMGEIPDSCVWNGVMEKGSQWAMPTEESARKQLRAAYDDDCNEVNGITSIGREQLAKHIHENYSQAKLQLELINDIETGWHAVQQARPESREELSAVVMDQLDIKPGDKTLLFTMPMSGGDVYLSTAVVAELRKRHPEHRVIFATSEQYQDILEANSDIDSIIEWKPWMHDVGLMEEIFTHVYTPNLAIQMTYSNWVHRGEGRNLLHEMAVQCGIDPNNMAGPKIYLKADVEVPQHYVLIHTGAGRSQWGARKYNHWQDVVSTLLPIFEAKGVKIVQVGLSDEPQLQGTVDLRGKTDYNQLAYVVSKAMAVASIDSLVMHMAAHHGVAHVALFGGSYANSTGTAYGGTEALCGKPWTTNAVFRRLIETTDRMGCDRACYKNECKVDAENPCINNIDPALVCEMVALAAMKTHAMAESRIMNSDVEVARLTFKARVPLISGYTHTLNAQKQGYPFLQSIASMLGFCKEVVVVDGGSTDDTVALINLAFKGEDRVKVIHNTWDPKEPGMDGMQKAFARVMCDPSAEFLWQQDIDEVVHEEDYSKVLDIARKFPTDVALLHLPMVELWGDGDTVRTDRHAWKWRLSRNEFEITHGIAKHARMLDQKTGHVYAKPGMSDGCEYIDVMTGEYIPHRGFWSNELDQLRVNDPEAYGVHMNQIFKKLPVIYHYSWVDIPRKIRNFKEFWDKQWSMLYNDKEPKDRFPDVNTEEDILLAAKTMRERGGEHGQAPTFKLGRTNPAVMAEWLNGERK